MRARRRLRPAGAPATPQARWIQATAHSRRARRRASPPPPAPPPPPPAAVPAGSPGSSAGRRQRRHSARGDGRGLEEEGHGQEEDEVPRPLRPPEALGAASMRRAGRTRPSTSRSVARGARAQSPRPRPPSPRGRARRMPGWPRPRRRSARGWSPLDRAGPADDDDTSGCRAEGDVPRWPRTWPGWGSSSRWTLRLRPPDRFQVICGFRRVAALRFLQREQGAGAAAHRSLRRGRAADGAGRGDPRLDAGLPRGARAGRASGWSRGPAHPRRPRHAGEGARSEATSWRRSSVEDRGQEIDADELAARRHAAAGRDRIRTSRCWPTCSTPWTPSARDELLEQLRYSAELVAYLEEQVDGTSRWTRDRRPAARAAHPALLRAAQGDARLGQGVGLLHRLQADRAHRRGALPGRPAVLRRIRARRRPRSRRSAG